MDKILKEVNVKNMDPEKAYEYGRLHAYRNIERDTKQAVEDRQAAHDEEKERKRLNQLAREKPADPKTHKIGAAIVAGVALGGYAAYKIKKMRCKKKCEDIKDPQEKGDCLSRC